MRIRTRVMSSAFDVRPVRNPRQADDAARLILDLVETNKKRYRDVPKLIEGLYGGSWFFTHPLVIPEVYQPPQGDVLIAYSCQEPIGTVAFCPMDGKHCELKWMFVSEPYRGSGVAAALCSALIKLAGDVGYGGIRLHTGDRQPEAHGLYRKLGFEEVAAWESLPLSGVRYFQRGIDA